MDLFKPRGAASPRNPTTDKQEHGPIVNQPRFAHLGGLKGPGVMSKNRMQVHKPADGKKVI